MLVDLQDLERLVRNAERFDKMAEKVRVYKKELKAIHRVHRLLILEHKELTRRYVELVREIAGFTPSSSHHDGVFAATPLDDDIPF